MYGCGRGYRVGTAGWVYRVGVQGLYRVLPLHRARRSWYSGAGPGRPAGPGVGGTRAGCVSPWVFGGGTAISHPCGARSVPEGPPWICPQNAASGPITARLRVPLLKHSQNGEVSPKSVDKACHSPCFQKRSQKSPLGILRFPLSVAFSHKELMGPF